MADPDRDDMARGTTAGRAGRIASGVGPGEDFPPGGGTGLTGEAEVTGPGADAGVTSGSRAAATGANLGETEALGDATPDAAGR